MRVRRYPSDLTDAEWAVVRTALTVLACLEGRGGRLEGYCHREMPVAVLCLVDFGIMRRAMPADFPAWDRVYAFFRRGRVGALVTVLDYRLRGRVRERLISSNNSGLNNSYQILRTKNEFVMIGSVAFRYLTSIVSFRITPLLEADRKGFDRLRHPFGHQSNQG